ncbi:hypothetical protein FCULG_00007067 [Fusarium culmorum]|uniref:Uncharacterized protein n=1 Tax=Fusarium culmorum TaxID=5516 RepID=A0A2T4GSG6_FUSCU|nr:hypothetical protein FCULG_00007067 [Fusarium culmorum]
MVKELTGATHRVTLIEKGRGYFHDWNEKNAPDEETGEVVDMIVKVLTGVSHLVTFIEKGWGYFQDWKEKRKEEDDRLKASSVSRIGGSGW